MLQRDDEPSSSPPKRIGPFEIEREIGRGGMGVVYRARQEGVRRSVALKVLSLQAMPSPDAMERFVREAEAAGQLRHPNIAQVYAAGRAEGCLYIAMELVEGKPLGGPMEPAAVARIGAAVARALEHAHERGIVHRDVKPQNVLLDGEGNPRLVDFGLARRDEGAALTMSGALLGTPLYMSPEQAAGRPIDARTDIYSLGATLYALVRGTPPFDPMHSISAILQEVQEGVVPPLPATVPRDLRTIVAKSMERAAEHRYQTSGALASDLERFACGEAILARPPSVMERLGRGVRRHPLATACIAFAALAAGIGAIWMMLRPGYVTLDVEPSEARVRIDEGVVRRADEVRRAPVRVGHHVVLAEAEGYEPLRLEFDVGRGAEVKIPVRLKPLVGAVNLETEPEGADLRWIRNGVVQRGKAPLRSVYFQVGTYDLEVEAPGHYVHRSRMEVSTKRVQELKIVLQRAETEPMGVPSRSQLLWSGNEVIAVSESEVGFTMRGKNRSIDARPDLCRLVRLDQLYLWAVALDGHSTLLPLDGGEPRWSSEPFCRTARATIAWEKELWILAEEGLLRLEAATGKRMGLEKLGGIDALPLSGDELWALRRGEAIEVRRGMEQLVGRIEPASGFRVGEGELIVRNPAGNRISVYRPDGVLVWSAEAVADYLCIGSLIVACSKTGEVRVVDRTGNLVEEWKLSGPPAVPPVLADVTGDGLQDLVVICGGRLEMRNARTGRLYCDVVLSDPAPCALAVVDLEPDGLSDAVIAFEGGTVRGVRGRRAMWSSGGFEEVGAPLVQDLTGDGIPEVVFASWDKTLRVVDGRTAELKVQAELPDRSHGTPALLDDKIVVSCADGRVVAIDPFERCIAWSVRVCQGGPSETLTIGDVTGDGQAEVLVGDYRHRGERRGAVHCLDAGGKILWTAEFDAPVVSAPLVVEGRVYVGTVRGSVVALEGKTGEELWTTPLESPVARPLVRMGDSIVAAEGKGKFVVLDRERGIVRSSIQTPVAPTGAVVLPGGDLLGAAQDGSVFCVDVRGGKVQWSIATRERIEVEPVLLPGDRAAVISRSGTLRVFDLESGRIQWQASLEECRRSPVIADLDGDGRAELLVAFMSGKLVALHAEGAVSETLWSGLGGDVYRTFAR